ncbi:MAG TPA: EamA family transporter RarD [Aestuariivirga sp.]|nr:EamA family transporter RarD [Alphaproteobacteria bacterium]HRX37625.1 EamA family transporter RarD [Aestuariivirga sp.]
MTAAQDAARPAGLTEPQKGVILALLAHLVWGGMAAYFGLLRHVSPVEIAANRGLWSLPVAALIIWALGQWRDVLKVLRSFRNMAILTLTSALIVFNWGFYVWSIEVGRTLESSLGYFINPLLNVVVGYLFLGERFTLPQKVALVLAAIAVAMQTAALGHVPWLGLMLASTFCLYGFLRKTIAVGPTQGFFIETAIIALPLLGAQLWLTSRGESHFGTTTFDTLMLMGCGVMTASALVLFAASIRRIRYSTAGLMQYISPSLVFLTAVFVFGEPLNGLKLASFLMIWLALAVFSISAIRDDRARRR